MIIGLMRSSQLIEVEHILMGPYSSGTCLRALMFKKLFIFSYSHPLSETRAQSALIG